MPSSTGPSAAWSGALALGLGVAASALCVDTVYTGPVAAALGGIDLALPVGLVVSAGAYALLMCDRVRAGRPADQP
ncbi:hypothetical protein [Streptomyces sp. NPDC002676]